MTPDSIFNASRDDRLEPLVLDGVSDHIFILFSEHKLPDNENLGYISRTAHTLPVSISLHPSLASELASKSAQPLTSNDHVSTLPTTKKHRRVTRHSRSGALSESVCVEFEINQSLELLNSQHEKSTTGAVLWKISPLLAEWVLTPGTVFHNLFFGHRECGIGPDIIEIGAGISGILTCAFSIPLFAGDNGSYIATDQSHILPVLKKNIESNIHAIQQATAHWMHRSNVSPYKSITITAQDKESQGKSGKSKRRQDNLRRKVKSPDHDLHSHRSHGSHSRESVLSGPRIEVMELDWEHATSDIRFIRDLLWTSRDDEVGAKKEFDVVIACDSVYNDFLISPFVSTLKLLAGESTHILIGIQLRSHDVQEAFLTEALSIGLDVWYVLPEHLPECMQSGFAVYYLKRS
ncbi:hypothetical protein V1517DRAFT_314354 [Lipomyces orientalis]|uniref:Uncharacterized protein n=1 Tax=Lipomyces orientalis TaxID=1233043 RepID=A0ACC3TXX9_9ASCO